MKRLLISSIYAVTLVSFLFVAGAAHAADPIDAAYNNKMIEDSTFRSISTMSEQEISQFLVDRGSALASYAIPADGSVPTMIGPNFTVESKGWSAAKVIHESAVWYNINPQVLLATLQKESSLVSSGNLANLRAAMGYACPESNACNPFYYGFARQMDGAAYQFMHNFDGSEVADTNRVGVFYKGNTPAIDGKPTYISNSATASLYRYTPHRPDSAYLYATDGSHYYGNYNFVYYFNKWFSPYNYDLISQVLPDSYMAPGATKTVQVVLTNTGSLAWYNETYGGSFPTRLQIMNEDGKNFYTNDGNWLPNSGQTRIKMITPSVAPGQNGIFIFTITAPATPGYHSFKYVPIVENMTQMPNKGYYMSMTTRTSYDYRLSSQILPGAYMNPGETKTVQVVLENTGGTTWYNEATGGSFPTRLQILNEDGKTFYVNDGNWIPNSGQTRIKMTSASVASGQLGTFTFTIKAPTTPGYHSFYYVPIVENRTQMFNKGYYMSMTTNVAYDYDFVSQVLPDSYMAPGSTKTVQVVLKNTGSATWYNDVTGGSFPTRLQIINEDGKSFYVNDGNWLPDSGQTRIKMTSASVAPGQNGTFTFTITAPTTLGYHSFRYIPIVENLTQMPNKGYYMSMTTR